mmetsp:Transcript_21838/g.49683  ORF Transcript_21838/g.49683 Transcript_21838/m.49683 type:complete len:103 (+) Transcript_21838:360-668(+)
MMNFFGKKRTTNSTPSQSRSAAANDPTKTVVSLRESLLTLEKREEHLFKKMDEMQAQAKAKMAKKDKKGEFSFRRSQTAIVSPPSGRLTSALRARFWRKRTG